MRGLGLCIAAAMLISVGHTQAQTPKSGGDLRAAITSEPDTHDCHVGTSFSVVHHLSPHYSFLLKFDQDAYPKVKGDLAQSWTVSPDGLIYQFRLRPNVKFHDGSTLTSADVAASYRRIWQPPPGVNSVRKSNLATLAEIETPDAETVRFRLSQPDAAMLTEFASPWNCIYSAAKLASDPNYPQKEVMGSGPFRFVERIPGSSWTGKRFEHYFVPGQPYLDSFKLLSMSATAIANSMQGAAIDGEFRFVTPAQRDRLVEAMGNRLTVQEAPLSSAIVLAFNSEKAIFADPRVRKALALAIDRRGAVTSMRRVTNTRLIGGFLPPSSPFAASETELASYPGYGASAEANRAEAKRLLAEAGVSTLKFKLLNRNAQDPWVTLGIFLLDQWRRIGLTIEQELVDGPTHINALTTGSFDVALDSLSDFVDEPSLLLAKFLSSDRSPAPRNSARYTDRQLDDLYDRQRRETDALQRKAILRQFEARLMSEGFYTPLFWGERITVHASYVKGWRALPSHFLNQSFAEMWFDK